MHSSRFGLEARIDLALRAALDHLDAQSGSIHLRDPGQQVLRLAASHGIPPQVVEIIAVVPWGKGMAGLAAERARPVDACNLQTTTSPDVRPGARATGLAGAIVVPMMLNGTVIGTFGVGSFEERTFTAEETKWLLESAALLATELEAGPRED